MSDPANKLTHAQRREVWAWYQLKRSIGTYKTKARELGVTPSAISEAVFSLRVEHGEYVRARDRRNHENMLRQRAALTTRSPT